MAPEGKNTHEEDEEVVLDIDVYNPEVIAEDGMCDEIAEGRGEYLTPGFDYEMPDDEAYDLAVLDDLELSGSGSIVDPKTAGVSLAEEEVVLDKPLSTRVNGNFVSVDAGGKKFQVFPDYGLVLEMGVNGDDSVRHDIHEWVVSLEEVGLFREVEAQLPFSEIQEMMSERAIFDSEAFRSLCMRGARRDMRIAANVRRQVIGEPVTDIDEQRLEDMRTQDCVMRLVGKERIGQQIARRSHRQVAQVLQGALLHGYERDEVLPAGENLEI
ncbi:hypothetical protein HN709_03545 [Candidatus Peregrinibacteria bacterium]|jgi:hypothetical protein|nr:hypothetical protein [Candidatus Peregrinibacteria bacterium]